LRAGPKKASSESKKPISASSVSALYEQFGLESKSKKQNLKGSSSKNCNECDDSTSSQPCDDSTQSDSCNEVCVKGCVPCNHRPFPRPVPYAVSFNITLTPLRGTIQRCNQVLVHNLGDDFMNGIERKLRDAGIRAPGGRRFLNLIPPLQTPVVNGYSAGFTSPLIATLHLQQRRIVLGRQLISTVRNSGEQLFGVVRQPAMRHPTYTQLGIARGQLLTGHLNLSFTVPLGILSELSSIARREQRFALDAPGRDLAAPGNNNNNDNSGSASDDDEANLDELL